MELKKVNRYIKTLENNNFIMVFHKDILAAIIYPSRRDIVTTEEHIKKKTIKEFINNYELNQGPQFIIRANDRSLEILFNNLSI